MFVLLILSLASVTKADKWAVLIAGSNSYFNYRHQADICHAYNIVRNKGGFPEENIITMMYDDIAYNPQNPIQGNIINKPGGKNVYPGKEHIDFTGSSCTAQNVLAILNGTATPKALKTNEDSEIFFYFADHGAAGLVAMPVGQPLFAVDFMKTLKWMHANNKYKEMVIYIEACESGSMLENLPKDIHIFGTTAANSSESSYATYWSESRQTYLGDEYSISWMEDTDKEWSMTETLEQQFKHVAKRVNMSHPHQFGTLSISKEQVKEFVSETDFKESSVTLIKEIRRQLKEPAHFDRILQSDNRDAKMNTLRNLMAKAREDGNVTSFTNTNTLLIDEQQHQMEMDMIFTALVISVVGSDINQQDKFLKEKVYMQYFDECVKKVYFEFEQQCGTFSDYGLKYVKTIANLCSVNNGPVSATKLMIRQLGMICKK